MIFLLLSAIKIIFLLGFLILIHELGHFTVAKLCKVKVNEFSIGFGPVIWKKQGEKTQYTLRLIPLGGFVSMEGEEKRSEETNSFSKASIPKRMAIVVAGATINIIFAIIVYFMLIYTSGTYVSNEIDSTIDGYAAQEAGLQSGDKILEIDGNKTKSLYDINKIIEKNNGEEITILIERNGEKIEYKLKPTEVKTKVTGIYLDEKGKIVSIDKGSSAEKQGLETNDKIIKINDVDINEDRNKAIEILKENKEQENVMLTVQRGKDVITINLIPDTVSTYYLGVQMKYAPDTFINRCINGAMQTKEFLISIVDNLKQLFTGKVGIDQMMGPVGISELVANTNGFREFFEMMALISLSLGVTNLLPIPALDGGKLLILLVEAIRRKPLKEETEINIQLIGFSILIGLSLLVTYNDILRIF